MANNQTQTIFNGNVDLINSIVFEESADNHVEYEFNLGTFDFRCSIFHESGSFGGILGANGSLVTQDPGFIDVSAGNYHLRYDSIAIDRCPDYEVFSLGPDRDSDPRGVDLPFITNQSVIVPGNYYFDVGADEFNAEDTPQGLIIVGSGVGCDVSEIDFAISIATPGSEIRVTNQTIHSGGINIDRSLTIKGGYSSCDNAVNDIHTEGDKTTVTGQDIQNTFYINTNDVVIELSDFVLTNGKNTAVPHLKGGALSIFPANNASVTLKNMLIQNSQTDLSGGGIHFFGNGSVLTLDNTLVLNNNANSGGGIFCSAGVNMAEIHLNNQSGVTLNSSESSGGGIYSQNCQLYFRSGTNEIDNLVNLVGISANTAGSSGGGVYADDSEIYTPDFGLEASPINIDNNEAQVLGAGIYLENSKLDSTQLLINRNVSASLGGGMYSTIGSTFSSSDLDERTNDCISNGYAECNLFINNESDRGGAIYIQNAEMENALHSIKARFENNHANTGAVAYIETGELRLQNSLVINNGNDGFADDSVFELDGADAILSVYFSTLANNNNSAVFQTTDGATANLHGSIVYEDFTTEAVWSSLSPGLDNFNFSCDLFHENNSIGSLNDSGGSIVTQTPGFIDASSDNYHLTSDSLAIDRCSDVGLVTVTTDRDLDERGQDLPLISNGNDTFNDAGFDEVIADNDIIFANGFE